jgi:hypothetical protein
MIILYKEIFIMTHKKPRAGKSNFPVNVMKKRAWFMAALLIFIW